MPAKPSTLEYDAQDDFAKSLDVAYGAIRERVAGWGQGMGAEMIQPDDSTEHRRKYRAEWMRKKRRKRDYAKEWADRQAKKPDDPWQHHVRADPAREPPDEALAERDRAYGAWRGATAELMGDPPLGRSALDRRMGGLPTASIGKQI